MSDVKDSIEYAMASLEFRNVIGSDWAKRNLKTGIPLETKIEQTIGKLEKQGEKMNIEQQIENKVESEIKKRLNNEIKNFKKEIEEIKQTEVIEIVEKKQKIKLKNGEHEKTADIIKLLSCEQNVLLLGPTGSGKTYTAKNIAEKMKLPFYYTNSVLDEFKLIGFKNAMGEYQKTPFYEAFVNGGVFLFDEIDASIPEALLLLNMALANSQMPFPNGLKEKHKDFKVIATANSLNGATGVYTGRADLDLATLNRFCVIEFNYDTKLERNIIKSYVGKDGNVGKIRDVIEKIRGTIKEDEIALEFSTRNVLNIIKVLKQTNDLNLINTVFYTNNQKIKDLIFELADAIINNKPKETKKRKVTKENGNSIVDFFRLEEDLNLKIRDNELKLFFPNITEKQKQIFFKEFRKFFGLDFTILENEKGLIYDFERVSEEYSNEHVVKFLKEIEGFLGNTEE